MNTEGIKPEKITKPIQLLGAWLLGLILVNASFLTAASQIQNPTWGSGLLLIATVLNVPIFLVSLFLLQTKFRPEMQEDTFYSKYLERKYTASSVQKGIQKTQMIEEKETEDIAELITQKLGATQKEKKSEIELILKERDKQRIERRIEGSRTLSELFLHADKWRELVEKWGDNDDFKRDLEELYFYNAIKGNLSTPQSIQLSDLGKEIAEKLNADKKLWNQLHERH